MSTLTDKIAALPPMPKDEEVLEHGAAWASNRRLEFYRIRLELACEALELAIGYACPACVEDVAEIRAVLAAVKRKENGK
jgi:hypothetical protein